MAFDVLMKRRRRANASAASSKRPLTLQNYAKRTHSDVDMKHTRLPTAYRDQFNVRGGTKNGLLTYLVLRKRSRHANANAASSKGPVLSCEPHYPV